MTYKWKQLKAQEEANNDQTLWYTLVIILLDTINIDKDEENRDYDRQQQLHKTLCRIREAPLKSPDRCHLPRPFSNDEDDVGT